MRDGYNIISHLPNLLLFSAYNNEALITIKQLHKNCYCLVRLHHIVVRILPE